MTAFVSGRTMTLITLSAVLIAAALSVDPIPQDPVYHLFADTRSLLGVPNFWNVVSNLPFIAVGAAGVFYLRPGAAAAIVGDLGIAYRTFFAGIFLTGIGSAYYHLAPGNDTLLWDRLPMTIGFMGLFTIIIGEHVSVPAARRMFLPLLIAGAGSVIYWGVTEARGSGDLRPYAIVQFLPMLLIPLILLMYRSAFDSAHLLWLVIALYALSKLFEYFDGEVFAYREVISGHSVKHCLAAMAALAFLCGIHRRRTTIPGSS